MQDFAANIRKYRLQRDMTMPQLAELIGTTKQYIYKIEKGNSLTIEMAIAISQALDIELKDLLHSNRIPKLHTIRKHKNP